MQPFTRQLVHVLATIIALMSQIPAASAQHDDPSTLMIEKAPGKVLMSYTVEELKRAFPIHERVTPTPWMSRDQKIEFRGPYLKDLLTKYLPYATSIEILAYNGFSSILKREEIDSYKPILAIERRCDDNDRKRGSCTADQDYRPLQLEDGGPMFLVWPLDELPPSYIPARNAIWVWFVVAVRANDE
ncbi:hypothetical protein ATN84_25470 [Paramesorhizobium deserti]|uniref:Oxidoreductase molybdopterin-binding domain-containing protein n=1 Tax=Paramesorhizobium deserti TaxID=1494590 RepID=A0A135HVG3_9HYPH|nr:hypothetical protein [Paramesorhizobium deserti]KXF77151.1 hypothetical protein ATN84_25470 [Paramesorhizobium deserti]